MDLKNIRAYENLHIVLWLVKDACWISDWKVPGLIMIAPTMIVALHITWIHREKISEVLHNLAIICWISANSTWMIGEFFFNDSLRPVAKCFFAIGLLLVGVYYLFILPKERARDSATNP